MPAVYRAACLTAGDDAGNFIYSGNPSGLPSARDVAGNGAAGEQSAVRAGKQSKRGVGFTGVSISRNIELVNLSAFLHVTEKPGIVAACFQRKPAYGVTLSQKNPAEGRNR